MKTVLYFVIFLMLVFTTQAQIITTYAGNGTFGYSGDGGLAIAAQLSPQDIAIDKKGDIFIADRGNNRIRKVGIDGIITTYAGTGIAGFSGDGGPATAAQLYHPITIATDTAGNVYFADADNGRIRKIDVAGIITTIAGNGTGGYGGDGGLATAAEMTFGYGLTVDKFGNIYFVNAHAIPLSPVQYIVRKIDAAGIITRFAGDGSVMSFGGDGGPATAAQFNGPRNLAVDTNGNLFIADFGNYRIRRVDVSTGIISTIAGNGVAGYSGDGGAATAAEIYATSGLAIDTSGCLYISDQNNYVVRKVDASGIISTIAGNGVSGFSGDGGPATAAEMTSPHGIAVIGEDNLFILSDNRARVLNRAPHFIDGVELAMTICMDTPMIVLDTLLAVADEDKGMPLTWSIASGPYHGSASIVYSYPSIGDTVMPTGLTYAPTTGYVGADTLMVRVSDAIAADTFAFYFTVDDCNLYTPTIFSSKSEGVSVYPNPAQNGVFTVAAGAQVKGNVQFVISDLLGRTVYNGALDGGTQMHLHLGVPTGTYIVKTTTETSVYSTVLYIRQ